MTLPRTQRVSSIALVAILALAANGCTTVQPADTTLGDTTETTSTKDTSPGHLEVLPSPPGAVPFDGPVGPLPELDGDPESFDLVVEPGDSLSTSLANLEPGAVVLLTEGTHRGVSVEPRDGDVFVGEPGAILNGAVLLEQSEPRGDFWVFTGRTEQGREAGFCEDQDGRETDTCRYPEDLFVDGERLERSEDLAGLEPGLWFFDYDADEVWLADDPTGRQIELAAIESAFFGAARDVVIRNLTIEKYASPAQVGAIEARNGDTLSVGWIVANNLIRLNHGLGIRTGDEMLIERNVISSNGQLGLGGAGRGVVVQENEITGNNTAGFNFRWEGGGVKFLFTSDLRVASNYVHGNEGPGLWTDTDAINTLYENNYVVDNAGPGIFHEISFDAVIRNNVVVGNGFGFAEWLYGAGILIAGSRDVQIEGNQVFYNANGITTIEQNRGAGDLGVWELRNVLVESNTVAMEVGLTGAATDGSDDSIFFNRDISFRDNTYLLSDEESFAWGGRVNSIQEWQDLGLDEGSEFLLAD